MLMNMTGYIDPIHMSVTYMDQKVCHKISICNTPVCTNTLTTKNVYCNASAKTQTSQFNLHYMSWVENYQIHLIFTCNFFVGIFH